MIARVLIIAGSDSGGGAGIQADIKTVTMLGGYAATAITAITVQNTLGVSAVHPVPPEIVAAQIRAVLDDIGADAIKIGMLGDAATIEAVADALAGVTVPIVLDPVMVAKGGSALLAEDAVGALLARLLPKAAVITPNVPELTVLTGTEIADEADMLLAAQELAGDGAVSVLAKGGHLDGDTVTDWLVTRDGQERFEGARIATRHTHGTGCTLASAIACGLAAGLPLADAVERARRFVVTALHEAPGLGRGHGPMGHQAVRLDVGLEQAGTSGRLNQITVTTRDYAASVAFYRALGLTQIVDAPPRYARFEGCGGATLSIHAGEAPGATVYFEAADLDARAAALGVPVVAQSWGWREAELTDPAGNKLILFDGGTNRRFPEWRLKS
ncbi:bifunctional hydroxymethylpyrimidine kinase/phosphomethylpyrimidine kinase [Sandaracinobacter neustonicus]|uniref:hydroxymethylpyrimidine kinase n=1 Tax=Sandaracinobacter neustonicus TaxID=1715348 RepID=A0A501XWF9_9SPHN|nr:bifunctional hydroxymethylpyrimidine kinase/phosphomethylpyrimidine kinase [Sandaracinobacter neustonicus]TPE65038.1 bifunctional hydroxymethylpyrimidine kinase/phosphomethylpyrimidine kinase [Sandaracinobacter neustonicus]